MKGIYRPVLTGILGLALILCFVDGDRKKGTKDYVPQTHVVQTAPNEYRVGSYIDPPPTVRIESIPRESAGQEATIYVSAYDKTGKDAGLDEMVVWEDCEEIGRFNPAGLVSSRSIKVKHLDEGVRHYLFEATDDGGNQSHAEMTLPYSGIQDDHSPTIDDFHLDSGGLYVHFFDSGDNQGIENVTLFRNKEQYKTWNPPGGTGIRTPLPDDGKSMDEYHFEVTDVGGQSTVSETINVTREN